MQLDVLVIAPHPDDAELAMGGTILKMVDEGLLVGILDLTDGEPTPYGDPTTRAQETAEATKLLAVAWRENLGLVNRRLEADLASRAALAGVLRQTRPRWIFAPYWVDAHPDHVAASALVDAARFWAKLSKTDLPGQAHWPERIFYYYCFHLHQALQPAFVVDISPYWERKAAILACYRSQFLVGSAAEPPGLIERVREYAASWGWCIGTRYGEPFTCREPIGLASLRGLL
ncbi:MAG: bacillithiol biosynthesis deacetylase BshB1 [Thermoguttaceae bacterium]|nr:bacillithiol biosynthesis deacetylase BshB1 [Thermoguttaceae bacterium]MDW8039718.1 bacillithiol biosynthesis deacetylase BshB1 [Thermoguttaceae bacterium]